MKRLILISFVALLTSCQTKEQKLIAKVEPIIRQIILSDSMATKIDSIKIYKIDTLTDLSYAQRRMINLLNKSDAYLAVSKSYSQESELEKESAQLHLSQERLYASLGSSVLVQTEKDEVLKSADKMKSLIEKSKLYIDSSSMCTTEVNNLNGKIKEHKINSKNFKGYIVIFKLLGSDKRNMEVKRDSLNLYLSPNFRIIRPNSI